MQARGCNSGGGARRGLLNLDSTLEMRRENMEGFHEIFALILLQRRLKDCPQWDQSHQHYMSRFT